MMFEITLIAIVLVIILCSLFVSRLAYKGIVKKSSEWAIGISILTFIGVFAIISFSILAIIFSNVEFGR